MKSVTVNNGKNRSFSMTPLRTEWDGEGNYLLENGKKTCYGQVEKGRDGKNRLVFMPGDIEPGSELKFSAKKTYDAPGSVSLSDTGKGSVDISVRGKLFATYNYSTENIVRPFIFPVFGPGNKSILRTPPLPGNPEKVDHRHHRGIWVSHGDINGINNWSEEEGHGYTIHKDFREMTSGPVFARIHTLNDWVRFIERGDVRHPIKLMEEERIITVYDLPEDSRIIDHRIILRATEGEAVFRDTKESGLLSIRVNPSMEERKGGLMANSNGGRGEDECWGQRASWCDYSGQVDGVKCGIAVFDQPSNLRYPTWWHIRSYGLFTANFFGMADFTGNKKRSGTYILPAYGELDIEYRIYIHGGSAEEGRVSERYLNFAYPPKVKAE